MGHASMQKFVWYFFKLRHCCFMDGKFSSRYLMSYSALTAHITLCILSNDTWLTGNLHTKKGLFKWLGSFTEPQCYCLRCINWRKRRKWKKFCLHFSWSPEINSPYSSSKPSSFKAVSNQLLDTAPSATDISSSSQVQSQRNRNCSQIGFIFP